MFPIIHITNDIYIPTYLLTISLTCCLLLLWVVRRTKLQNLNRTLALDFSLVLMIGAFLGARLFHVLYESPDYYREMPIAFFYFWQGGFVFYGGLIGAILLGITFAKMRKVSPISNWFDFFAPIISLGYALGRIGCLLAGCCYGTVCDLPWGIHFSSLHEPTNVLRHPTQLYSTAMELIIVFILLTIERYRNSKKIFSVFNQSGNLFFLWLCLHGIGRLIVESFRGDFRGEYLMHLSVSSWFSLVIIIIGLNGLIFNNFNKDKTHAPTTS